MQLVAVQGSMMLDAPAAAAWFAFEAAARAEYGVDFDITSPAGAWRSEAMVLDMYLHKAKYGIKASQPVAKPKSLGGRGSVHENGTCVDLWNHAAIPRKSLVALARRFGFTFTIPGEPWHMQHSGSGSGGGGAPITPKRKAKTMTSLYHKQSTESTGATLYALAGDSPGTPANWLETTAQSLANAWSAQIGGASAGLNDATWDQYKAAYSSPLNGSAVSGAVAVSKADVDAAADRVIAGVDAAADRVVADVPPAVIVEQKKPGN